jgi:hypothetical protein
VVQIPFKWQAKRAMLLLSPRRHSGTDPGADGGGGNGDGGGGGGGGGGSGGGGGPASGGTRLPPTQSLLFRHPCSCSCPSQQPDPPELPAGAHCHTAQRGLVQHDIAQPSAEPEAAAEPFSPISIAH